MLSQGSAKAVKAEETGLASGLVNTMQRVGSGLGIAVLTALATARVGALDPHASLVVLAEGFQTAMLGAAGLALLGGILTLTVIRPQQEVAPPRGEESSTSERSEPFVKSWSVPCIPQQAP